MLPEAILICIAVGFGASLVIARIVSQRWRVQVFISPFVIAALCVGTRRTGYDRWDVLVALVLSVATLIGWVTGFGINGLARRRGG